MRVQKKGKIVDIPVTRGTIVRLRESGSGKLTTQKAIVVGTQPSSNFSRAYGKQVYVCSFYGRGGRDRSVSTTGAGDLYPVGKVKRIPAACKEALAEYEATYPTLARKKRKR